jgi:hypothetical protein
LENFTHSCALEFSFSLLSARDMCSDCARHVDTRRICAWLLCQCESSLPRRIYSKSDNLSTDAPHRRECNWASVDLFSKSLFSAGGLLAYRVHQPQPFLCGLRPKIPKYH